MLVPAAKGDHRFRIYSPLDTPQGLGRGHLVSGALLFHRYIGIDYSGAETPTESLKALRVYQAWARFPMDLGHNLVLAHPKCNGDERDRLAALDHLAHWRDHVDDDGLRALFDERSLPHDLGRTLRVARWAYSTADGEGTQVWQRGKDGLVALTDGWRHLLDQP